MNWKKKTKTKIKKICINPFLSLKKSWSLNAKHSEKISFSKRAPWSHKKAFFGRSKEQSNFKRACSEWDFWGSRIDEIPYFEVRLCTICRIRILDICFVIENYKNGQVRMDSCLECLTKYVRRIYDYWDPFEIVRIKPPMLGRFIKELVYELEEEEEDED